MRPWLPHLFYPILLAACALFYRQTLQNENQLLAFLYRPTDEAYTVVQQSNLKTKGYIDQNVSAYRSSYNIVIDQRLSLADSMLKIALAGNLILDSIRIGFDSLVEERIVKDLLGPTLPSRNVLNLSVTASLLLLQSDSLRLQIAFNLMLNYFATKTGGYDIRFDPFEPVFSFTTLCPPADQPFQMDVFLSSYASRSPIEKLSINGVPLEIENDVALYRHTFDAPGDYPLKVEVGTEAYNSSGDSIITTQKTFFIHVNR